LKWQASFAIALRCAGRKFARQITRDGDGFRIRSDAMRWLAAWNELRNGLGRYFRDCVHGVSLLKAKNGGGA
jgi:hypothetical protein